MTVARSVARAVASPVARAAGAGIGGGLTLSQVVADAVGYWPLQDDAASTTVIDEGTGTNNGALAGAGNTSASSVAGPNANYPKALTFDGTDDHVGSIGSVSSYSFMQNAGNFTLAFWMKATAASSRRYLIGNSNAASSGKGFAAVYEFGAGAGNNAIRFFMSKGGSPTTVDFVSDDSVIADTDWHHVAIQVESDATPHIWIDGSEVTANIRTAFSAWSTGDSSQVLNIGRVNLVTTLEFGGAMAGVGIWNRILTGSEIAVLAG